MPIDEEKTWKVPTSKGNIVGTFRRNDLASSKVVVFVHGLFSYRNCRMFQTLAAHMPGNSFRIDIRTCGESWGKPTDWRMGSYWDEVKIDIREVVEWLRSEKKLEVICLCGHSRGANEVLMYAAFYGDIPFTLSLAARAEMDGGIEPYFKNKEELKSLLSHEVEKVICAKKAPDGETRFITYEDLQERLSLNMEEIITTSKTDFKKQQIWLVHGEEDSVIPHKEVFEFTAWLSNDRFFNIHEEMDTKFATFYLSPSLSVISLKEANHDLRSPFGKKGFEPLCASLETFWNLCFDFGKS